MREHVCAVLRARAAVESRVLPFVSVPPVVFFEPSQPRRKPMRRPGCLKEDKKSGGHSVRVPPLPIPNREVKPHHADGTAKVGE